MILQPYLPTIVNTLAHYFSEWIFTLAISQETSPRQTFLTSNRATFYEENGTYFRIVYLFAQGELSLNKGRRAASRWRKMMNIFYIS